MSKAAAYKEIEAISNKFGFERDYKTTKKRNTGVWSESDKSVKFSMGINNHFYIVKNDLDSQVKFLAVFHPDLKEKLNTLSGQGELPFWSKVVSDDDWKHNASFKEFPKRMNKGKSEIGYGYPIYFDSSDALGLLESILASVYSSQDLTSEMTSKIVSSVATDDMTMRLIEARQGQGVFRSAALERFNSTCVVTGSKIVAILEAAHIMPYADVKDTRQDNALLLRSDIHTLFDLGLIRVEVIADKLVLNLSEEMMSSEYAMYQDKALDIKLSAQMKENTSERNLKYFG